jgi:hypothetical protein
MGVSCGGALIPNVKFKGVDRNVRRFGQHDLAGAALFEGRFEEFVPGGWPESGMPRARCEVDEARVPIDPAVDLEPLEDADFWQDVGANGTAG